MSCGVGSEFRLDLEDLARDLLSSCGRELDECFPSVSGGVGLLEEVEDLSFDGASPDGCFDLIIGSIRELFFEVFESMVVAVATEPRFVEIGEFLAGMLVTGRVLSFVFPVS